MKFGLFGKPVEVTLDEKLKYSSNYSKTCWVIITDSLLKQLVYLKKQTKTKITPTSFGM